MIDVCMLGTGGMMPLPNRFLSAGLIRVGGRLVLLDCGEAAQIAMKQLGWGFKELDYICLTHFHADHVSGLPGVLLTMSNSERTEPLTIIGPTGAERVCESLRVIAPELSFGIRYIETESGFDEMKLGIDECGGVFLSALPTEHSMPCLAYSLTLRRIAKFDAERAKALNIPIRNWSFLQHGQTVTVDGSVYTPDMVLGAERKGIKVSFVTDTRPTKRIPAFIQDSDLFICEGLYGDDERKPKARQRKHMVFSEAAALAKAGNVKRLWLTHFSPSMPDPYNYLDYARRVFGKSYACKDGCVTTLTFDDEE